MSTAPRLRRPERHQASFDPRSLDQLLPPDHQVRVVWQFVEGLDLADFLARIKAVPGRPGQPATDPRLLLALWLQATADGVGSARALDTLCAEHLAYRWLCGGVTLNHHTPADFRGENGELLDRLLTQSVATLVHQELVTLEEVARDGLRVRASAGAHSFRREATLNELLREAEERVEALKKQDGEDGGGADRRGKAARKRAAEERLERVKRALEERAKLAERQEELVGRNGPKAAARAKEPRASTTDPDARRMMMADGGVRPALNVEFATDTASGIVVGLDVVKVGSDGGQLKPMVDQLRTRYATVPRRMPADGNFAKLEDIQALHEQGTEVYAPVKNAAKESDAGNNPFAAKPRDAEGVGRWRERMGTEAAKEVYRRRASTAEWANARARAMGLRQFAVRGVSKAKGQAVLVALAHNLRQVKLLAERSRG